MSYDLFFRSRTPGKPITQASFAHFFESKPAPYSINGSQSLYSNEDTGVYFSFDFRDPADDHESDEDADATLSPVSFNLNYFRPHPFGLEAAPEVEAFVEQFDLLVSDPQTHGMGDGDFSIEGFLRGWNAGNEFAYRAIVSQDPSQRFLTLPASKIDLYWRWNVRRNFLQQEILEETGFVPKLFFFDVNGIVQTGIAWGDGTPILIPEVDLILMPRKLLAPCCPEQDMVVASWQEALPFLNQFPKVSKGLDCFELFYHEPPSDLENWIRHKEVPDSKRKGIAFDQILNQEMLEEARK